MSDIVNKLWGFCHTLRHDGIDYGDYIEQLTYLLFLKMADERDIEVPKGCDWASLKDLAGTRLTDHYVDILRKLREAKGILGDIFAQSMPRFNNPVNLKRVINMIDEEHWSEMDVDVKGAAFEGLLERAASEGKKGAGQYFTPRVLIQSIVRVMKPDPRDSRDFTICDPACGTGGFLVCAYEWLMVQTKGGAIERKDIKRIKSATYYGQDLVPRPRRLALMNLFLHGLEAKIYLGDTIYEPNRGELYSCVLTNPPFGTKGANQAPERDDFTIETSNKQLNFVQHVMNILKSGGRAAIVLPDNCLFENKAGEVFEILMQDCNLHTVLRLPRGTFTPYSQGVKANVIFFQKGLPTENVWIFDARSNVPGITKKDRPLTPQHFEEFEKCYGKDPNGQSKRADTGEQGRFRKFHISEIKDREYKLDITWLKDESIEDVDGLPEPQDLASEAITELEAVVDDLKDFILLIEENDGNNLSGLPKSWVVSTLGECFFEIKNGTTLTQNKNGIGIPVSRIETIQLYKFDMNRIQHIGKISKELFDTFRYIAGDIAFSHINSYEHAGKTALYEGNPEKFIHGMNLLRLRLGHSYILPKFVHLFMQTDIFRQEVRSRVSHAVNQVSINQKKLGAVPIVVAPLNEQHRIVDKLEKLLHKINDCKERLSEIMPVNGKSFVDKITQSILAKAFRGELVPQDPNDEPASVLVERIKAEQVKQRIKKKSKRNNSWKWIF